MAAQEQINTLSTQIADLENASEPLEPVEFSFEALAAEILPLLQSQDFAALAPFIHPELGVRISPYGYVNVETDLVFSREEVAAFGSNQQVYLWGVQAGSGMDITLTIAEYWPEYVTSQTPTQAWALLLAPTRKASNTIDNFAEVYPTGIMLSTSNREQKSMVTWTGNRCAWAFSKAGMGLITDGNHPR